MSRGNDTGGDFVIILSCNLVLHSVMSGDLIPVLQELSARRTTEPLVLVGAHGTLPAQLDERADESIAEMDFGQVFGELIGGVADHFAVVAHKALNRTAAVVGVMILVVGRAAPNEGRRIDDDLVLVMIRGLLFHLDFHVKLFMEDSEMTDEIDARDGEVGAKGALERGRGWQTGDFLGVMFFRQMKQQRGFLVVFGVANEAL